MYNQFFTIKPRISEKEWRRQSCTPNILYIIFLFVNGRHSIRKWLRAVNVWQRFSIQTLGEYRDLHLKNYCWPIYLRIFGIVASSVMDSIPRIIILLGLMWDAMLKHTRVNFELLINIDMVLLIEHEIMSVWFNVPTGTRKPTTNICSRTINDISDVVNNLYSWSTIRWFSLACLHQRCRQFWQLL